MSIFYDLELLENKISTMDPAVKLLFVKISNFKTYKGDIVIGPFRPLSIVIGKNGSGKSNFTEAIGFVLGASLNKLRVGCSSHLIHGGNVERPAVDRASVTAGFSCPDGTAKEFCRTIVLHQNGSTTFLYQVNEIRVLQKFYLEELKALGVYRILDNYFVLEGSVDAFVRMKPKDFTSVIESLSESESMKAEYDTLISQINAQELRLNDLWTDKKALVGEKKTKKIQLEECNDYIDLLKKLENVQLQEKIFLLFINKQRIESAVARSKSTEEKIKNLEKEEMESENKLKDKNVEELSTRISETESELLNMEIFCEEKSKKVMGTIKNIEYLKAKLKTNTVSIENERKICSKNKLVIEQLEDELKVVEEKEEELEELPQRMEIQLNEENVNEYNRLKQEAWEQTSELCQQLSIINIKRMLCQEDLDFELLNKSKIDFEYKMITKRIEESRDKLEKVNVFIREKGILLQEKRAQEENIQADIKSADEEIQTVKQELKIVVEKLQEVSVGNICFQQMQKKHSLIKDLKTVFGDNILGYIHDLCRPVHERYRLAISKVMSKNFYVLVVKDRKTGLAVIEYLKSLHLPPQLILPLDSVRVSPIKERLRDIGGQIGRNVKLLLDVIECRYPHVEPAIRYAVSNTLVCDDIDVATYLAYKYEAPRRHNVVTLDGSYFRKDGTVSCGKERAFTEGRRWRAEEIFQLENKKVELREKLRELQIQSSLESQFKVGDTDISVVEIHLNFSKEQQRSLEQTLSKLEANCKDIRTKTENADVKITQIKQRFENNDKEIHAIEEDMKIIEDSVFGDFCSRIGVPNIRSYEGVELSVYQERVKKRAELQALHQNIVTQIEYEKERLNSRLAASKDEKERKKLEDNLKKKEKMLTDAKRDEESSIKNLNKLKLTLKDLKNRLFQEKKQVAQIKENIKRISNELNDTYLTNDNSKQKLECLDKNHHSLLLQCKIENFTLPLVQGSMEDIQETDSSVYESSPASENRYYGRMRIQVDYGELEHELRSSTNNEASLQKLRDQIEKIQNKIKDLKPNMKVAEEFKKTQDSLVTVQSQIDRESKLLQELKREFKKVEGTRTRKFMMCFEVLEKLVDQVYKQLYDSESGMAMLTLENNDEPFNGGVRYSVQVPGKKCIAMDCLSGGEAAMASLAFMFTLNRYKRAAIIILDEPDGALDKANVLRLCSFLKKNSDLQITLTTHTNKHVYATVANDLYAVTKQVVDGLTKSNFYMLSLDVYQDPPEPRRSL